MLSKLIALGLFKLFLNDTPVPSPPQPVWPTEWTATLTQENLTTSAMAQFNLSYSVSHNATLSHVLQPNGAVFDQLFLYNEGKEIHLYQDAPDSTPVCSVLSTPGSIQTLPLEYFDFNGTIEFLNETYWFWTLPPIGYATEQTSNQFPKLFLNTETNLLTVWTNFVPLEPHSWAIPLFTQPSQCSTAKK